MAEPCRVYWGSHGCQLNRGHDGVCVCDDSCRPDADEIADGMIDAGRPPYYGPDTVFYGEDAADRGLPTNEAPRRG